MLTEENEILFYGGCVCICLNNADFSKEEEISVAIQKWKMTLLFTVKNLTAVLITVDRYLSWLCSVMC